MIAELMSEQFNRGWTLPSVESSVASFYEVVFAANSCFRKKVAGTAFAVSQ
jgi:hypothetical protein